MRIFYILLLVLCLSFTVIAQEDIPEWECPEGFAGQSLDVFNWFYYIAEDTIPDFETSCHVDVNYTEFDEEGFVYDTLVLGNPGYDLVTATGAIIAPLKDADLLIPLDYELIPNVANLSSRFLQPSYDLENQYTLPYAWGSMGIIYRRETFPEGLDSWEDVWDFSGGSAWIDDGRAMLGVALLNLGYDPNSSDSAEILAARDFLGEHGVNIVGIGTEEDILALFENGAIDLAIAYSGTAANLFLDCNCNDYNYIIPQEGSNIFVDSMFVPMDADNPELAMVFMNYILDPQVSAEISNLGFGSANQSAQEFDLIDPEFAQIEGFNPDEALLQRMFYVMPLSEEAAGAYEVAWTELLSFYALEES